MTERDNAYLRHQQKSWLRPDGHRWVCPDAARFLKPGAEAAKAYPALDRKYSSSQRRVPAGRSDGGQWTSGNANGSGNDQPQPMGSIDFGDLSGLSDLSGLFQIAPTDFDLEDLTLLAGDVPTGDSPEPPSNEPPEIPTQRPESGGPVMKFIREAVAWTGRVGRYSPYADVFFGALQQIDETNAITNAIKSANDPPRPLEELQDRVGPKSESGYHDHHIVEESSARDAGFSEDLIQGRDNLVRIPVVKHIDITSYYARKTLQSDGSRISPRQSLESVSFEERRQFGLQVLREQGVLK
jgi:hypothetical protein